MLARRSRRRRESGEVCFWPVGWWQRVRSGKLRAHGTWLRWCRWRRPPRCSACLHQRAHTQSCAAAAMLGFGAFSVAMALIRSLGCTGRVRAVAVASRIAVVIRRGVEDERRLRWLGRWGRGRWGHRGWRRRRRRRRRGRPARRWRRMGGRQRGWTGPAELAWTCAAVRLCTQTYAHALRTYRTRSYRTSHSEGRTHSRISAHEMRQARSRTYAGVSRCPVGAPRRQRERRGAHSLDSRRGIGAPRNGLACRSLRTMTCCT